MQKLNSGLLSCTCLVYPRSLTLILYAPAPNICLTSPPCFGANLGFEVYEAPGKNHFLQQPQSVWPLTWWGEEGADLPKYLFWPWSPTSQGRRWCQTISNYGCCESQPSTKLCPNINKRLAYLWELCCLLIFQLTAFAPLAHMLFKT